MREDDAQRRATPEVQDRIGHGVYGPGAMDEVSLPPADETRELQERDVLDPADVPVDPEDLREGRPGQSPGAATTTGGRAGPASVRKGGGRPRGKGKVAPTTTGDATTGGMSTPTGGTTSDASSAASRVGNFSDHDDETVYRKREAT